MSNYENFSMQLFHSESYTEAFNAYEAYIQAMAFQSMSYVFIPNSPFTHHQNTTPRFSVTDSFDPDFLEEYETRQFQNHDYIVDAINRGESSKLYLWAKDYKHGKVKKHQKIVLDSANNDYNMGNGFSILTAKCKSGIGAVSLVGDHSDKLFLQYIKEHQQELRIANEAFHNHVITRSHEVSNFIMPTMFLELKKTEKQVLKCLLKGLSAPQIADKIFRSIGHVEHLIIKIRIKVGGEFINGKPRISKDRLIHFCGLMRIYDEL